MPEGCTRCAKKKPSLSLSDRAPYVRPWRPWVNGADITRFSERQHPGTDAWSWQWIVCPACLCVSRVPRRHAEPDQLPACQAPPSAEIELIRTRRITTEDGKKVHLICGDAVWLADLSPRINQILEAVFTLRGLAPVIDILDKLGPVEFGFDDPGGAPHQWDLSKSRPKSIKRKYKKRGSK